MNTKMEDNQLYFKTGNTNKFNEIQRLFKEHGMELVQLADEISEEIQGTSVEVILNKCKYQTENYYYESIVEDTSLELDALNGLPGPYIKSFNDQLGHEGIVKMLNGFKNYKATARSLIAKNDNYGSVILSEGTMRGTIVPPRGVSSCWNCIFQPDGFTKTLAEMSIEELDSISYRRKAVDKFVKTIKTLDGTQKIRYVKV